MMQGLGYEMAAIPAAVIAEGLCPSLCTIRQPDGLLIDAGQPSGTYQDVDGLVDIPCMNAPMSEARMSATEIKKMSEIQAFNPRHVWLAGAYPSVASVGPKDGWIAVVDGSVYDLLGADIDSQGVTTRLSLRSSGL